MLDDRFLRNLARSLAFLLLLLVAACGGGGDTGTDTADSAGVSIASPGDGASVPGTFPVTMETDGFTIEPAGEVADGAGHFHLVVDAGCLPAGEQIPADETHIHLADGASETELSLPAGEHTLCLQAGDGQHAALALTDEITVTVAGDEGEGQPTTQVEGLEEVFWEGTYEGEVVWDCGPAGTHRGTLEADVYIGAYAHDPTTPTLRAEHTVTGSCADVGSLTTVFDVEGKQTGSGYTFPSTAWGVPGSFTIRVNGDRAGGRLSGEVPGPGTITIVFDLRCTRC